jgi:hypothetical protein
MKQDSTKAMTTEEILSKLKEGANFKLECTSSGHYNGFGAINRFDECKTENNPSPSWYNNVHYPTKKKILESLPWTGVVDNPYNPKEGEYPTENGDYITMLDCDEHAVWTNIFRDGHWLIYDRTHVKWWMPMPDMTGVNLID